MSNGEMFKMTEYYVRCANFDHCGEEYVDYHQTKKQFIVILRELGWHKQVGLWYCKNCNHIGDNQ